MGLGDSDSSLYRRGTAAALFGAPLLFLVANLLHPEEFTRDHERQQLAEIASNYTRWQLAHFFTFSSVVAFAAAVLGLAYMVRRRRPGLGLIAGGVALAGLFGLAFVDALDGYSWAILGEVSSKPEADPSTMVIALHDMQQSTWSIPYYLTPLLFIAGVATLAVTAARQRQIPMAAGLLLALGVVMVGVEGVVQDNGYFIASASVLLAGGAATAAAIWRMTDEQFRSPGRISA